MAESTPPGARSPKLSVWEVGTGLDMQEGCIQGHLCWTAPAPESGLEQLSSHHPRVNNSCLVGSAA